MSVVQGTTESFAESSSNTLAEPSFKERLALRRKELEATSIFELKVPGYEGLWARYRGLGYDPVRRIGLRIEEETDDQATGERLSAAETLTEACIELLQHKGTDTNGDRVFEGLGYSWTPAAARDLFDVSLPPGVNDRDAILAIFPAPRDILMMAHFNEFLGQAAEFLPEMEEVLMGESQAVSEPTTSDSQPGRQSPESL